MHAFDRPARVAGLAVALTAALASPAAAQFGTNLIQNPGAEAGPASTSSGGSVVSNIPAWTRPAGSSFTVIAYGSGNFPGPTSPGPAGGTRGSNFFAGGPGGPLSTASQTIDLGAFAGLDALIDAGEVGFTLGGFFGGFGTQDDAMLLLADFLDGGATLVGSTRVGDVTPAERAGQTGLLERTVRGLLPRGTRSIRLTLQATRRDGTSNDGYADNLALVLAPATTVPEPASAALLAGGLLTLAGAAARQRRRTPRRAASAR